MFSANFVSTTEQTVHYSSKFCTEPRFRFWPAVAASEVWQDKQVKYISAPHPVLWLRYRFSSLFLKKRPWPKFSFTSSYFLSNTTMTARSLVHDVSPHGLRCPQDNSKCVIFFLIFFHIPVVANPYMELLSKRHIFYLTTRLEMFCSCSPEFQKLPWNVLETFQNWSRQAGHRYYCFVYQWTRHLRRFFVDNLVLFKKICLQLR